MLTTVSLSSAKTNIHMYSHKWFCSFTDLTSTVAADSTTVQPTTTMAETTTVEPTTTVLDITTATGISDLILINIFNTLQ